MRVEEVAAAGQIAPVKHAGKKIIENGAGEGS